MKKIIHMYIILFYFLNGFCFADVPKIFSYDNKRSVVSVISSQGGASVVFHEKDEGNSSYFFDFFGGAPAIVHDNNSLNSYSSYSLMDYRNNMFYIDCVYVHIKSNQNGINSKEGVCGLNIKAPDNIDVLLEHIGELTESIVNRINMVDTSFFLNGKVKYLPVVIFQSQEQYVYKLYKTKEEFLKGKYDLISCKIDQGSCELYENETWFVRLRSEILFQVITKQNDKEYFGEARGKTTYRIRELPKPPFCISAGKAYFYDLNFNKMKSYLVKNDKITLLSMDEARKWCSVNYINNKEETIKGNMLCKDLVL